MIHSPQLFSHRLRMSIRARAMFVRMFRIVWIVWDGHHTILSNHPQEDDRFFKLKWKNAVDIFYGWECGNFFFPTFEKKIFSYPLRSRFFFTYIDICRWVVRAVSIDYEPSSKRRLFQIEKYYNSNRARFAWKIRFFLTDVGNIFSCKLRFRLLREATPVSTYSVLALEVESDFYLPYIFPVYMRVCARKTKTFRTVWVLHTMYRMHIPLRVGFDCRIFHRRNFVCQDS